ncbi:hypothetical protein BUALT_Bualt02G0200800 [Buddleja alternifolia]|uniref:Uncharacterized protein n=1 Tax=Buddleja alternifolia TaxID=168488 RepID=A0AAV6Y1R6_9LAMI|nr:hypothetical protein BUALT_Bualt02G0200800 [Buddleja alternifolia]
MCHHINLLSLHYTCCFFTVVLSKMCHTPTALSNLTLLSDSRGLLGLIALHSNGDRSFSLPEIFIRSLQDGKQLEDGRLLYSGEVYSSLGAQVKTKIQDKLSQSDAETLHY